MRWLKESATYNIVPVSMFSIKTLFLASNILVEETGWQDESGSLSSDWYSAEETSHVNDMSLKNEVKIRYAHLKFLSVRLEMMLEYK